MYQILFRIPIKFGWFPEGIPVYGYGMMLFLAFIVCTWLAGRRAEQAGIRKSLIQDLAIWLFIGGLLGSRITYLLKMPDQNWYHPGDAWQSIIEFFKQLPQIWNGGVVFYGGAIGGVIAYALAYFLVFRKLNIPTLKMADIVAPSIAVGLCLGRIGCLLNGCCYGQPAPTDWYALHFPLPAPVTSHLVEEGSQTALGFTLSPERDASNQVVRVEAGSAADREGLREGDSIVALRAGDKNISISNPGAWSYSWPRGENSVEIIVKRKGETEERGIGPFVPLSMGVQPTQVYESISMALLCLVLLAYGPFRRHDGEVVALLMMGYGVHRWLNEMLRSDVRPEGFEQYTSLFLILMGVGLFIWARTRPAQHPSPARSS